MYPRNVGQSIGFTGGINASNVKEWLSRYHARAAELGCACLCDAQTGFRQGKTRGQPIDAEEFRKLLQEVYEWGKGLPMDKRTEA